MAASRPQARPLPRPDGEKSSNRRIWLGIAAAVSALVALPVGVSVGLSWLDRPGSNSDGRSVPDWMALAQVRATTIDGAMVKARVALDVEGLSTRTAIERRSQQVGLLLEVSVASHTREQIRSAQGIERLAQDMRSQLNNYLESEGVGGVRSVAIQDLLVNSR